MRSSMAFDSMSTNSLESQEIVFDSLTVFMQDGIVSWGAMGMQCMTTSDSMHARQFCRMPSILECHA